jgi:predicted oxidoreductase
VSAGARIILGGAQWGMPYGIANASGAPDEGELRALLDLARAAGIGSIDTARAYGASEARIGAAGAVARGFAITTKLAPDVVAPPGDERTLRARTEASVDSSLRALGTARVDALLLHRAAQRRHAPVWDALRRARDAGRIGRLGVSAANPDEAWAALADPDVEQIQVATSLLDQRLVRAGFFARARALGRRVHVRSVFLQGVAFLSPDALPPRLAPLVAPLARIRTWAAARGLAAHEPFLLYARALDAPLVLGFERSVQLEAALATCRRPGLGERDAGALAALVPPLAADVLDPSRWAVSATHAAA